jgi:hypothetical protein
MDAMNEIIKQMVEQQVKSRLETEVKARVEAELKSNPTYSIAPPQQNTFDPERFNRIAFAFRGGNDMWRVVCLAHQTHPERFSVYGTPHANNNFTFTSAPAKVTVRWTISESYFVPIHFYGKVVSSGAFMVECADIVLKRSEGAVFMGNLSLTKANWADNADKFISSGDKIISGGKSSVSQ